LEKDPVVRVVMLSGEGDFFCAGADLNWMKSFVGATKKRNETDARTLAKLLKFLDEFPKPTIARVQGAAVGGGVGLLAACDMTIADEKTVFSLAEVKLGLIPAVISPYVIGRMGVSPARRYFLTGERFSADVALRIGLIQEVTPSGRLEAAAEEIARQLLTSGPEALRHCKELIRVVGADLPIKGNFGEPGRSILEYTVEKIATLRAGAEAQEGMTAFLEKRKPNWNA
jgi:methylglutaconyl-CoA hydratase